MTDVPFLVHVHYYYYFFSKDYWLYFCVLLQYLSFIIFDPFVDLFVTLCIVVNTLFMALDHHDMDPNINETLQNGNYVCSKIFIVYHHIVHDVMLNIAVFHGHVCHWGCDQVDGHEPQILLPRGLEHFRLHHRHAVPGGVGTVQRFRPLSPPILQTAPCFQIGQILANAQLTHFHYGQDSGGLGQPNFRVVHHYLHLRCHGDATLWQKLSG